MGTTPPITTNNPQNTRSTKPDQATPAITTTRQNSHVIRLREHSTTSKNVAIPTNTIQCLKQSRGNYVRNWWALRNRSDTGLDPQGFSRSANSSPHSAQQTRHAKPHRTHSAAQTTKLPPTRHALHPQFPRIAPDADTPRGRPGGRPLGVSHQHSASSPSKLLKMSLVGVTRARVARAVFPCDDTYCRRPTLRQRQGQLRKSWDFDPTDNWKQNECAPPVSRERTPCHAHSACCGISRSTGHSR